MSEYRLHPTTPHQTLQKPNTFPPAPDFQVYTNLWHCPRGPELICSMCTRMIDGTGMAYVSVKYCVVKVVQYVFVTSPVSLAFLKVADLFGK